MRKYYLQKQSRKVLHTRNAVRKDDVTPEAASMVGPNIDWDCADRIAIASLKDHLSMIRKRNEQISLQTAEKPSKYLQEDFVYNLRLIEALITVLSYYGYDE